MNQSNHSVLNLARQGLCVALLYAAATAAVYAALRPAVVLPPLTQPASGEHHVGKVIWADLVTPDLDGAKRFYGALFGWTFHDVPGDRNYALALLDGEPVAGLFQKALPAGQSKQPAWLTFIAVRDVDAAQQAALQHGGKVMIETALLCAARPTGGAGRSRWRGVCRLGGRGRRSAGLPGHTGRVDLEFGARKEYEAGDRLL